MSASSTRSSSSPRRRGLLYALLWLIITIPLLIVGTAMFGHVQGIEFCPQDFSRRTFSYYEVPLVGIQATPIHRTPSSGSLESLLLNEKWISAMPVAHWDLVRAQHGQRIIDPGTASILCNYLDAADGRGNFVWHFWSQNHKPQAARLWPLVADLARSQLYYLIPDLMRAAQEYEEQPADQFDVTLKQLVAQRCVDIGDLHAQQGAASRARACYQLAVTHHAQHPEAAKKLADLDGQLP